MNLVVIEYSILKAKLLNAIVFRVRHVNRSVFADGDAARIGQLVFAVSGLAPTCYEVAVFRPLLHAMIAIFDGVNVPCSIDCDAIRIIHLSGRAALNAETAFISAGFSIQSLDAMVADVGDQQIAFD